MANPSSKSNLLGHGSNKTATFSSQGWFWEIAAIVVSFGCTVAVACILATMNNQPLSFWSALISLNATVAVFVTIAKSSALLAVASCISQFKWIHFKVSTRRLRDLDLFEDASRGPWGSLLLLLRVRWNASVFVAIGALATILALGIDTFAQQLVALHDEDVERPTSRASFGITDSWDGGAIMTGGVSWGRGTEMILVSDTVDTGMEAATLSGIYNISSPAVFDCPSNCVWHESYVSLGFISHCEDVTADTLQTKKFAESCYNDSTPACYNMTTPGNISLTAAWSYTSWQVAMSVVAIDDAGLTTVSGRPRNRIPANLIKIAVLRVGVDNINWLVKPDAMEVYECTLGFAAYNYSNVSTSGSEFTVKKLGKIDLEEGYLDDPNVQGRNNIITFNQTGLPILRTTAADMGSLVQLFTGTRFSGAVYDGESPPASTTGIGMALRHGDIGKAFENMALSMTEHLRGTSNYNNTAKATGFVIDSVVYVHVVWPWLILPIFVQLASLVLLISTIIIASKHTSVMWKSSNVAILYHDITPEPDSTSRRIISTDIKSIDELERTAEETAVKLEQ